MLILDSTTDVVQVVTSASASITCHVSYVDNNAGTISFASDDVATITTNTTTQIVPSPGAGVVRNVKNISLTNNHATASSQVTVQHSDGTHTADLMGVTLLPGENLIYSEDGEWKHHDAQGGEYGYSPVVIYPYAPTGVKAESIPRTIAGVNIAAVTSGTMIMQAIWLPSGMTVSNLIAMSGTTASATQTNRWLALYDQNRALLRQSTDQTTTVLAANTLYTAPITSYTTTYAGIYYIGLLTAATTVNSWCGVTAAGNLAIRGLTPILTGTSTTALTTTAPATAAAITATANSYWVAVS